MLSQCRPDVNCGFCHSHTAIAPAEYLRLLREREREAGLRGDPETDAFLKAAALQGKRHSVSTEYIIRLLGLDVSPHFLDCIPAVAVAAGSMRC